MDEVVAEIVPNTQPHSLTPSSSLAWLVGTSLGKRRASFHSARTVPNPCLPAKHLLRLQPLSKCQRSTTFGRFVPAVSGSESTRRKWFISMWLAKQLGKVWSLDETRMRHAGRTGGKRAAHVRYVERASGGAVASGIMNRLAVTGSRSCAKPSLGRSGKRDNESARESLRVTGQTLRGA